MTAPTPFDEARALFAIFLRGDWRSIHVAGAGIELFASRTPDHANPMLGEVAALRDTPETAMLAAPHIATLVDLVAIGTVVAAGDRYGAIELLGERADLIAAHGGTVRRHVARTGSLVEFDHPLVALG